MCSYRCDLTLTSLHDGEVKNCQKQNGSDRVAMSAIFGWNGDPEKAITATKETVQNYCDAIDEADKRVNSRIARECLLSLPAGMSSQEYQALAADISKDIAKEYSTPILTSMHFDTKKGVNGHLHIIIPTRSFCPKTKRFGKKLRHLDDRKTGPIEMKKLQEKCVHYINKHKDLSRSKTLDKRRIVAPSKKQKCDYMSVVPYTRLMPPEMREKVDKINNLIRLYNKTSKALYHLNGKREVAGHNRLQKLMGLKPHKAPVVPLLATLAKGNTELTKALAFISAVQSAHKLLKPSKAKPVRKGAEGVRTPKPQVHEEIHFDEKEQVSNNRKALKQVSRKVKKNNGYGNLTY